MAPVDLHLVYDLCPADWLVLLYGAVFLGVPAAGGEPHLALSLYSALTAPPLTSSRGGAVTDQDWPPDFPHHYLTLPPGHWLPLTVSLTLHHLHLPALGLELQPHLLAVLPLLPGLPDLPDPLGPQEELEEEEQQDGR